MAIGRLDWFKDELGIKRPRVIFDCENESQARAIKAAGEHVPIAEAFQLAPPPVTHTATADDPFAAGPADDPPEIAAQVQAIRQFNAATGALDPDDRDTCVGSSCEIQ